MGMGFRLRSGRSKRRRVRDRLFGYAVKRDGEYVRVAFGDDLDPAEVDFSPDAVLVREELARRLKEASPTPEAPVTLPSPPTPAPAGGGEAAQPIPLFTGDKVAAVRWRGALPPQKWTTFYTKVLSRLVAEGGLELTVELEAKPAAGLYVERVEEMRQHLRELGVADEVEVEEGQGE